jgi:hypothetical protein
MTPELLAQVQAIHDNAVATNDNGSDVDILAQAIIAIAGTSTAPATPVAPVTPATPTA